LDGVGWCGGGTGAAARRTRPAAVLVRGRRRLGVLLGGLVWLPVQPVQYGSFQLIQAMLIGGLALLAGRGRAPRRA
jgi:hypothetical protein